MPLAHILYIPAVLMVGLVLGWILGSRAAKDEIAREEQKKRRREERAREREQAGPAQSAGSRADSA